MENIRREAFGKAFGESFGGAFSRAFDEASDKQPARSRREAASQDP